jgi:hypothetical protein
MLAKNLLKLAPAPGGGSFSKMSLDPGTCSFQKNNAQNKINETAVSIISNTNTSLHHIRAIPNNINLYLFVA